VAPERASGRAARLTEWPPWERRPAPGSLNTPGQSCSAQGRVFLPPHLARRCFCREIRLRQNARAKGRGKDKPAASGRQGKPREEEKDRRICRTERLWGETGANRNVLWRGVGWSADRRDDIEDRFCKLDLLRTRFGGSGRPHPGGPSAALVGQGNFDPRRPITINKPGCTAAGSIDAERKATAGRPQRHDQTVVCTNISA